VKTASYYSTHLSQPIGVLKGLCDAVSLFHLELAAAPYAPVSGDTRCR
jgi:hypothetical protein